MFVKDNEYLQEAAESLYVANADEIVRQQCIAREDAERRERTLERDKKRLEEDNKRLEQMLAEKEKEQRLQSENLKMQKLEIEKLKALLAEHKIAGSGV